MKNKMEYVYLAGIIAGLLILLFAPSLGDFYGHQVLSSYRSMDTDRYNMITQSAIFSFQAIGAITSLLSGLAYILKRDS